MTMEGENPFNFRDFLEEEPRLPFNAALNRFKQTGNQRNFFQNQFGNIFNRFLGTLGQQVEAGGEFGAAPTLRFEDFLGGRNQFDPGFNLQNSFRSTAPSLRGGQPQSFFAPRARQFFF